MTAAALGLSPVPASAAELFGIQIPGTTKPVPAGALAYAPTINLDGADAGLLDALKEASLLVTDKDQGAADVAALAARARADHDRLLAALYAEAHYGATISIRIAGTPLEDMRGLSAEPAIDAHPIHVDIAIAPGPLFRFGAVQLAATRPHDDAPAMNPADYGIEPGAPARSTAIITAIERLQEAWRMRGFPLASVARKEIAADHARNLVDVDIAIDPGPPAVYGWVNVTGAKRIETGTIAAQSALKPGRRYDPRDLKRARERLRKLEGVESVRIIEGREVDASGGIPVTLEVSERKQRYIGATASMSTLDGGEARAYWGHRNLLGEGERLRVDAALGQIGNHGIDDTDLKLGAEFVKPGILDIDTDLFTEFRLEREHPDTYESRFVKGRVGLMRRMSETLSGSVALETRYEEIEDAFGRNQYLPVSMTGELVHDSRDNRLDPGSGYHATLTLKPTADALVHAAYVSGTASLATYRALQDDDRVVLAGRILGGFVAGATVADVPASERLHAGGGGSVRGYQYRSLGTLVDGRVVGGLALIGASMEARIRLGDRFGIVPFLDIAAVSHDTSLRFADSVYVGAGVGLRYYTALGPLRLDVAVPLGDHHGQSGYGIYLGLGQAF